MIFSQSKAPVLEAMTQHLQNRVVPFDVPGHKGGRGNSELTDFLGKSCLKADVNSMKPLDNLCHPVSVIKEAQDLAAEAFGAKTAFFIVNGTTGSVQTMIMTACKSGDKIIMPRNVHRSAINALVVNGAIPVYVNPGTNKELGIPLGMSVENVKKAIAENPDAKAVLINNPTYYGVCSDLREIVRIAHENNMLALVDEAHGTHFYFGENMPVSGMAAGADMAAVSMHKTGGSLTQSSILLCGSNINSDYVRQVINLTQTTSGSYLLISSLDIARKNLALNGKSIFKKTVQFAEYARNEINKLGGYYAFGNELCDNNAFYDFDKTKLSIHTRDIGLAGIEVYDIQTREHIDSLNWDENQQYKSADDYIEDLLAENIDSECVSPKGNYTVDGFNMLLYTSVYPKEFIDFLDTEGFSGYTPVYKYEKGSSKYYIYNPDGEVFLESDRKVYLIKRDNKVCYTKVNKANKEVEVYSLSDRELISTFSYDFYTYYTYNQYDIMG